VLHHIILLYPESHFQFLIFLNFSICFKNFFSFPLCNLSFLAFPGKLALLQSFLSIGIMFLSFFPICTAAMQQKLNGKPLPTSYEKKCKQKKFEKTDKPSPTPKTANISSNLPQNTPNIGFPLFSLH